MAHSLLKKRLQRIREYLTYQLMAPLRWLFNSWMHRRQRIFLYCTIGDGIGDALALSTILNSLHEQKGYRAIVFSMFPQLFWHNPLVVRNIGYHDCSQLGRSLLKTICRYMRGPYMVCFGGEVWTLKTSPFTTKELDDGRHVPNWIWMTHMVPDGNVQLDPLNAKPQIYFSQAEEAEFSKKYAALPPSYALLKATVGVNRHDAAMLKNWDEAKFAEVVARTPQVDWVQVGNQGEPLIPGATNLLGQTSLREVLFLLSRARLILSVEGFLTHASAAFEIPCVVPFTGVHEPKGLLYRNTIPVEPDPRPDCMPCWQERCTTEGMPCRSNIAADRVINIIHKLYAI